MGTKIITGRNLGEIWSVLLAAIWAEHGLFRSRTARSWWACVGAHWMFSGG